jgi:hypothetical protein
LQLEQFEPFGVVLRSGHELQLVVLAASNIPTAAAPTKSAVRTVTMCRKSRRSRSSVRVSAASTKIFDSCPVDRVVMTGTVRLFDTLGAPSR